MLFNLILCFVPLPSVILFLSCFSSIFLSFFSAFVSSFLSLLLSDFLTLLRLLFSSFYALSSLPSLLLPCSQGETVHRDGEWDGQWGEVSGRSQPQVSGQLPRLPPALQQPQPQSQQLPALPPRYSPAVLSVSTSGDQNKPQVHPEYKHCSTLHPVTTISF